MESERIGEATPRIVFGLILFTLGVLFLLDRLDLVEMGRLWDYWPLVFVGVGLGKVIQPVGAPGRASGGVFIVIGVWWLLANLDVVEHNPVDLWPVVLFVIGGSMLWRAREASRHPAMPAVPPAFSGALPAMPESAPSGSGSEPPRPV